MTIRFSNKGAAIFESEIAAFESHLAQIEREAPFAHFDLGVAAAKAGHYAAARDHLLREMKRDPDYHEFHFWIAIAYLGLGDVERARLSMDTAMRNSTSRGDHDLYAAKLSHLKALAATPRVQ